MDNLNKARQVLARQLLADFKSEITGDNIERVVGQNPENVYFLGKLMAEDEDVMRGNTSKAFINSIGVDFYIDKSEMPNAVIEVFPQGDLYYRVFPTYKEQCQAYVDEYNLRNTENQISSFSDLEKVNEEANKTLTDYQVIITPVYKKCSFDKFNASFSFHLKEILNDTKEYGFISSSGTINDEFSSCIASMNETVNADAEFMASAISEPVTYEDLTDDKTFRAFLINNISKSVESQRQNWNLHFEVSTKLIDTKYLISISLVNDSKTLYSKLNRSRKNSKLSIETLFNSGFKVKLHEACCAEISMDCFMDDYKYDTTQYAIGNNCAIALNDDPTYIQTVNLPIYEQYRLVTNDKLSVKFKDLIETPIETLATIYREMEEELNNWKNYASELKLSGDYNDRINSEIKEFEGEIKRYQMGISVIKNYPIVMRSFVKMNSTFLKSSQKYDSWRLFQIVFITTLVPDIVACDSNVMPDDEKIKTKLSDMSLLYFPTGGGKTEAFLGVLIFNLFFDRYRGKTCGVTSILKYPLRLLSVQQVQRLANIMAQAELIREKDEEISGTSPFSLGYYVGDRSTPNKMEDSDYERYNNMPQRERDESRVLDICPFCHKPTVHIRADKEMRRLVHYCDNPECPSGGDLELYIVDSEIYRYLPSAIISTVDKLAIMGSNPNFRSIINGANHKCTIHGYTTKTKCLERNCKVEAQDYKIIDMYDPAPSLIIQDELHLIRESLGTYDSHYESFLRYYIRHLSKSQRDVKIIGATATISSYRDQVYHLYKREPIRFPCESPYKDKNFYAHIDSNDLQRLIIGYAPYGKAFIQSIAYSIQYMREVVYRYVHNPNKVLEIPNIGITEHSDAVRILEDYWIFLEYNNVKRDGNNIDGAISTPVNPELEKKGIPLFKSRKMTGDETFQDVREVLAEVENTTDIYNGLNLIIATSMISHGVDADKFNIMFFYGIPGNMAEYIQAYSRTGRRYPSIVVDLIRPSRERDKSFLQNFVSFHKFKDLLVEPVPINRWATNAIYGTLPGIFASLLLMLYDQEAQYSVGTLFYMNNIKKAIKENIIEAKIIKEQLKTAYTCIDNDSVVDELGKLYSDKIDEFVDTIIGTIEDMNWDNENIGEGFKHMGYKIMKSLRDTDTPLTIEME